jgi:ribonuclease R
MSRSRKWSEQRVLEGLRASKRGPLKVKELAKALGVAKGDYQAFRDHLRGLAEAGKIYRVKGQRYAVPDKINLVVGTLSCARSGDGFVQPERGGDDVYVPPHAQDSAMDGDQVVVRVEGKPRGRSPVGRVIKILDRARETIVGTFHASKGFGRVIPADAKLGREIIVPGPEWNGAADGDIVVVRIDSYGSGRTNATGHIQSVLGKPTDRGVDVLMIIHGHGLDLEFPAEVDSAASGAAREGRRDPGPNRVDRTDLLLFTIDPADAKDHDDALSIDVREDGSAEVGVHIADVSHFVEEGGAVDLEAFRRGTSVYLVDRVLPMLPHALSSDACSLIPDADRFALSVFAVLDREGRVREHRFERTRVRSRARLSYEEAQSMLDDPTPMSDEHRALRALAEFARVLRLKRKRRGSIDFDLPEAKVLLGSDGVPTEIRRVERLETHKLVEDFMLMANELVAKTASDKKLPVLYRIHEPPPADKLHELKPFLAHLGHPLGRGKVEPKDLQQVLERVRGRPEERLVSTVVLRSMSRARYDGTNRGHFGLAAKWYAHFTSPIRRYPDLWTHRVLARCLIDGEEPSVAWDHDAVEQAAARASFRGRIAEAAERDSVSLKKAEYMERHLGDVFRGTISGVTSFGLFVLLDDVFVEGLVHVNAMNDDYYVFQPQGHRLVGERSRRIFRLGDRTTIQVSRVDRMERLIDFVLVDETRV